MNKKEENEHNIKKNIIMWHWVWGIMLVHAWGLQCVGLRLFTKMHVK